MSSSLQFVRTLSGLTILLQCKPYSIASTEATFAEVIELIKQNATEEVILAVVHRVENVPTNESGIYSITTVGASSDEEEDSENGGETELIAFSSIRGGYAGQNPEGEFEIFVDDAYLMSFESFDSALDYANRVQQRYDQVSIKSDAGATLASFLDGNVQMHTPGSHEELPSVNKELSNVALQNEGILNTEPIGCAIAKYRVTANGVDKGTFDSLPEAKSVAIGLFGSESCAYVLVQDAQGETLLMLEN